MDLYTIFAIAIALAMDAFAVSIVTGLRLGCSVTYGHMFRLSFFFGFFQFMMTVLGWFGGLFIKDVMQSFDHWIALGLLLFIGGKMLWESFRGDEKEDTGCDPTTGLTLLALSVATSIDAFAVGLSLGVLRAGVWFASMVIGLVAAAFTVTGMRLGTVIGTWVSRKVEILGGLILIGIGLRILFEHVTRGI
jgi:manganese efflux pump family protein